MFSMLNLFIATVACGPSAAPQDCEDTEVRLAAINALQRMESDQYFPTLKRLFEKRDSCSVILRRKALQNLRAHTKDPDPEVTEILTMAATTDPDADVRKTAINLLSSDKSDEATMTIGKALTSSMDEEVQRAALNALAQRYVPGARKAIRDYALQTNASHEMRVQAVQMLGHTVQPQYAQNDREGRSSERSKEEAKTVMLESAGYLREIYPLLETQRLKQQVIGYLAQFGGEANLSWIVDVATSSDEIETRKLALSYAAGSRHRGAKPGPLGDTQAAPEKLVSVYDKLKERSLKQQLVSHFASQDDDASFNKLVAVAKGDRDSQIRAMAVSSLSQSRHAKAKDALAEIVAQ